MEPNRREFIRLPEKIPCSLSCHCGSNKRRPRRHEDYLVAFQQLHNSPLHAEVVRQVRHDTISVGVFPPRQPSDQHHAGKIPMRLC